MFLYFVIAATEKMKSDLLLIFLGNAFTGSDIIHADTKSMFP